MTPHVCLCLPEEGSLELSLGCMGGGCQEEENTASRGSKQITLMNGRRLQRRGRAFRRRVRELQGLWVEAQGHIGARLEVLEWTEEGFGKPWIGLC